jgi:DNA topoisomerase-1
LADALVLGIEKEIERELVEDIGALRPEEALVLAFVQRRLADKISRADLHQPPTKAA